VKATWSPESSYEGGVRLYATMVQDYSTYWTRLPSQLIQVRQVSFARNTECIPTMAGIHSYGRFFALKERYITTGKPKMADFNSFCHHRQKQIKRFPQKSM
jgi:hypothetical protein